MQVPLKFEGRAFCFTGKLLQLKRTQAERETRARGGMTVNEVTDRLDVLVVGSKASAGWKYGNYGTKIATAREIAPQNGGRPMLVSESTFMDALVGVPTTGDGALDAKILVCNYSFIVSEQETLDAEALEKHARRLQRECGCHVHVIRYPWRTYRDLFDVGAAGEHERSSDSLLVHCRIVRQMSLDESTGALIDQIAHGFETIPGVDGKLEWFERTEGTAGYVRLLTAIPQELRVTGL